MNQMKAMMLTRIHDLKKTKAPLVPRTIPIPTPGNHEILIRVAACGVCHTELDEIEGRTPPPRFPVIPGHQVVGRVDQAGPSAERFSPGQRVGVAWINRACGRCDFCRDGKENLCPEFAATGRDAHGGYAQFMTVHEAFAFPIPDRFSDVQAAPLLCAGAIGYRSMALCELQDG
jgi:propanol-preferring alcohol dehydrogenase